MDSFLKCYVNPPAVAENLRLLRTRLASGVRLCAVVKCDAYGHGLDIVLDAVTGGADALAVMTGPEAMQLRRLGYVGELLMLFPAAAYSPDQLDQLVRADTTLTLASENCLAAAEAASRAAGKSAMAQVMVNSGMTRGGVRAEQAPQLIRRIRATSTVKLTGAYTHFATADELDRHAVDEQMHRFESAIKAAGGRDELVLHAANSAATIDLPQTHLDMVRPGLAVYGYQPRGVIRKRLPLRPALRVTAPVLHVHDVAVGEACGYGLAYRFERAGRCGLVGIGYGDGYLRSYSNRATMIVRGRAVPVRGRVSMDQTIVDLTDADGVRVGDEVTVISDDPAAANSVEGLAELVGTVCQEVTCRLGGRLQRLALS